MNVLEKLNCFYDRFDKEKGFIGLTENANPIPFFKIEKTERPVIIATYGIHAREYITTCLALRQIEDFDKFGKMGTVYFIPAVNVDGIKKVLNGESLYKANANGVDLNVNFDARWGSGLSNLKAKGSANFIGKYPFSEKESRALRDFTLSVKPDITLSYHSKGEEIYWYFFQKEKERDYKIAKAVSQLTGYTLRTIYGSCGGYKDWCIEKLKIPSLTIEVGSDYLSHPIGEEFLEGIYEKNKSVVKMLTELKWI